MLKTENTKRLERQVRDLSERLDKSKRGFFFEPSVEYVFVKYNELGGVVFEQYDNGYTSAYQYNKNGGLEEEISFDDENKMYEKQTYEYDKFNNVVKIYTWRLDYSNIIHTYTNEYSSAGLLVRSKITSILEETGEPYGGGEIEQTFTYTGPVLKKPTSMTHRPVHYGTVRHYEYAYDNRDNVVLEREFELVGDNKILNELNYRVYDLKNRCLFTVTEYRGDYGDIEPGKEPRFELSVFLESD